MVLKYCVLLPLALFLYFLGCILICSADLWITFYSFLGVVVMAGAGASGDFLKTDMGFMIMNLLQRACGVENRSETANQ